MRKALSEVMGNDSPMFWVCEDGLESGTDPVSVARQRVLEPVKRLHDSHGGSPGPEKATGGCLLEVDSQFIELNRAPARVGMDSHSRRNAIRQPKIVGCRHAVDQQTQLIATSDCVEHGAIIRGRRPFGQPIDGWEVV
ncbi:hypothetical protein JM78_17195 [Burkholderia pyrrocinia]|nr:hypothetical protein JM78_17195 [Burkholderia pyrrocinia]